MAARCVRLCCGPAWEHLSLGLCLDIAGRHQQNHVPPGWQNQGSMSCLLGTSPGWLWDCPYSSCKTEALRRAVSIGLDDRQ